jgi:glycosyltransferase involved in cell wall biosynthesis
MSGVSVIIPAFNAAATVAESLQSVRAQTFAPDEVILVDDGSSDDTAERALAACPGLIVVRQAHAGAAAATNAGFGVARAPLVAMLDADDLWPPDKLARQAARLAGDAALDGVGGHVQSFPCPSLSQADAARFRLPSGPQPSLLGGALMIRRHAHERVGPYDESLPVGFAIDWIHRARLAGLRLEVLDEVVLRRRIRGGSLSAPSAARDRGYLEMARRAIARTRGA